MNAHRSVVFAATLGMAALAGCQKAPVTAAPPNPETARTFDAVASQLDSGGDLYLYLRTEQILAKVPAKLDEWKASFETAMAGAMPLPKDQLDGYYGVLRKAVVDSGLTQLRAYGLSSVELPGSDLSRTKSVVYTGPLEKPGMLWELSGRKGPHPLASLDFVPADAVYASFADFDPSVLWNYLLETAEGIPNPEIRNQVSTLPSYLQLAFGMTPKDLFASLDSEWGFVVTADPTAKMTVPSTPPVEMPLCRVAVLLRVKDDKLHDVLLARLQALAGSAMPVKTSNVDGVRITTVAIPQTGLPLEPTLARFGDYLVLATEPKIVTDLARKGANLPPLMKDTAEFKRLTAGEPLEGNAYAYFSERGTDILRAVQMETSGAASMPPAMKEQMRKFYDTFSQRSLFSIARIGKDGCTSTMISPDGAEKLVAAIAVIPVAAAAIAVPAILEAKKLSPGAAQSAPAAPPSPDPAPPQQP